jgi:hypothetical protein
MTNHTSAPMSYDLCMEVRQRLLQAHLAIPADARENHWIFGDVTLRSLDKGGLVTWLTNGINRLRATRPQLP